MANTKSAKKAFKQSQKRRMLNVARKSAVRTALKKVNEALRVNQSEEQIKKLVACAAAELSRAKSKGVIHKNNASRRLSRLMIRVGKHSGQSQQPEQQAQAVR